MAGLKLPPGFRFHPTDLELVTYYLKRKVHGLAMDYDIVAEVDLYKCEPWDLPDKSLIGNRDPQWYFYCARDKKYANGSRTNRATEAGYWKATGKDRAVKNSTRIVGMKKTLVFYRGRAPHGERTDWVMHEYRLEEGEFSKVKLQDAFVLCRVLKKTGIGANNPEYNSASLDIEEVDTTIKEDILLPDESSLFPQWQGLASPVDALTNENAFVGSECPILSVPSKFLNAQDASDHDKSIFNTNLLNDLNQSLDTFNTLAGPTSELAKLDTVPNSEDLASLMTAQDLALSLEAPDFSCGLGATTSVSFNHFNLASNYSHEEADILDELYRSTLQSQGSKKPFEEGQVVSLAPLNGTEVSEEDIMEELLQLINQSRVEGQQSYAEEQRSLVGAKFQDESTVSDLKDVLFDFLEEPNVDILTNAWNETATSQFEVEDVAVKPCTDRTKNWFNDSLVSVHDLPSFSEALPDFLSMQITHNSFEEQAKAEPRTDMNHINDPLEGSTSTAAHFLGLQDDILKPSSRFSRLLDSIPVLPASAAEFPPLIHKTNVKSKDFSIATPDQNFSSMQMAAWNASFTAMNFRVSCEFMQGFLQSSALEGSKHQVSILKDKTKSSTNALIYELVPENSSKGCCFRGRGNSCFSIMFLLGALSALCWFLLLRFAWRLASYMGCLVL